MEHIGDLLGKGLSPPKPAPKNLHTDVHEFVEETRIRWHDTYPFGRWLGKCEGVPTSVLFMIRGDVEGSQARSKAKLFFSKVGTWKKGTIHTPALHK